MSQTFEQRYPEHQKLKAIQERSQAIGEFIEWLPQSKKKIHLAVYPEDDSEVPEYCLLAAHVDINELLAEFYGINLKKIETEKRAMLDEMREANKKR
jgi:hypothetical protein